MPGTCSVIINHLINIDEWRVWYNSDRYDQCTVRYERNGKKVKEIKTVPHSAYKYVSDQWEKDVKEEFQC